MVGAGATLRNRGPDWRIGGKGRAPGGTREMRDWWQNAVLFDAHTDELRPRQSGCRDVTWRDPAGGYQGYRHTETLARTNEPRKKKKNTEIRKDPELRRPRPRRRMKSRGAPGQNESGGAGALYIEAGAHKDRQTPNPEIRKDPELRRPRPRQRIEGEGQVPDSGRGRG